MKILLLNQCFYPDVVATAQQLTDLAAELSRKGHQVTVITSDRGYDNPSIRFRRRELWNGINIIRVPSLALGKNTKWRRAVSFASFILTCTARLLLLPKADVTVALTSPPLISLLGALFVRLKGGRFVFWVMDLNPDAAIAAGWLKERSLTAKLLERLLHYSFRHASAVVVLDRFMEERIRAKGVAAEKIAVLPPWAYDDVVRFDPAGREVFRNRYQFDGKFVVMYSGNHSPCHPLDTLLAAAHRLSHRDDVAFCFIGGGTEQTKVKSFAEQYGLSNVKCLPYQPLRELSGSLSGADLHTVVMGDRFSGIVHPSKVYNVLAIGTPLLFIGPAASHVEDIAKLNTFPIYSARHGEVDRVVANIVLIADRRKDPARRRSRFTNGFSRSTVLPRLIELIEGGSRPCGVVNEADLRNEFSHSLLVGDITNVLH